MSAAPGLKREIYKTNEDEHASSKPRERRARPLVQLDAKPNEEYAKRCGRKNMTATGKRSDSERLWPVPTLRTRDEDKGQPVCWNSCVKERHRKTG